MLFFVLNIIGMGIALGCLWFTHYALGFDSVIADNISANVIGLALGTIFRFWSYRKWVFQKNPKSATKRSSSSPRSDLSARSGVHPALWRSTVAEGCRSPQSCVGPAKPGDSMTAAGEVAVLRRGGGNSQDEFAAQVFRLDDRVNYELAGEPHDIDVLFVLPSRLAATKASRSASSSIAAILFA